MSPRSEAGAIVLVGGRSSRMGAPKLGLDFGGVPMLTRIVVELKRRFDEIVIVAAPPESSAPSRIDTPGVKIIHDDTAFGGPLDALRRGLIALEHDAGFACSCDLPLLNVYVADALVGMLEDFDAVIPEIGGMLQPMHAVYRKRCADAIATLAATGEKRMTANASAVNARRVGETELRALDPDLRSFFNVNTPEDYARALELAHLPH